MKEKKVINFAVMGAGMVSASHADAIKNLDSAKLLGVCSKSMKSAQDFAEKYNVKVYASYEELLCDSEIDAVCICTPSGLHREQAIKALEHGKHVVLEKPIAITEKDADIIIEAMEKSGKKLVVISQNRYTDGVRRIKELCDKNAFGKISIISLYMKYWRDPEYYSQSSWRGTLDMDGGGALMNQGIHGVDLLLYFGGNARLLCGRAKTSFHNIDAEDTAVAMVEFDSGALGMIEASTCAYPGFERRIEIMGSRGCAILNNGLIEKLVIDGKEEKISESAAKSSTASVPNGMGYKMHEAQISDFIDAINGEGEIEVTAYEGKKAVSLIENIYKMSKEIQ